MGERQIGKWAPGQLDGGDGGGGGRGDGGGAGAVGKRRIGELVAAIGGALENRARGGEEGGGGEAGDRGAIAAAGVASAAARLPAQDRLQKLFGRHDLRGLRVADDDAAGEAARKLGARAYAFGDKISLGRAAGLREQAHEAVHYLQQQAGLVDGHGEEGDVHERQAEDLAERVERGEHVEARLDAMLGAAGAAGGRKAPAAQLLKMKAATAEKAMVGPGGFAGSAAFASLLRALQAYEAQEAESARAETARLARQAAAASRGKAEGKRDEGERKDDEVPLHTIALTSAVLSAAKTLYAELEAGATAALPDRITRNLGMLIAEANAELAALLREELEGAPSAELGRRIEGAAAEIQGDDTRAEHQRVMRYQEQQGFVGRELRDVEAGGGPAIIQSWRARGDMYHVGAAMNLYPELKVILYDLVEPPPPDLERPRAFSALLDGADQWKQAVESSRYYGQPERVFYTFAPKVSRLASKGHAYEFVRSVASGAPAAERQQMFLDVGGATLLIGRMLEEGREQGAAPLEAARRRLADAVAPEPREGDGRATREEIVKALRGRGWSENKQYVIVNFRGSGHGELEKKLAQVHPARRKAVADGHRMAVEQKGGNHPDLDTGVLGQKQLATLVSRRGFTPIFMGEEPSEAEAPHLVRYWELPVCKGGRAAEAFFLRVLAETFDVRALAMRSGVTDQLAFLGMPTISIDIDNLHQAAVPELLDKPGLEEPGNAVAHSWARGIKLEAGLGRSYGRVFLDKRGALKDVDARGKWKGNFGRGELAQIDDALGFYFGEAREPADPDLGVRHRSHPLHPGKLAATAHLTGQADGPLGQALWGKNDSNLNADVVLDHVARVLAAAPPQIEEAHRFLESHLRYTSAAPEARADNREFLARRRQERIQFLRRASELMAKERQDARYREELAQLEAVAGAGDGGGDGAAEVGEPGEAAEAGDVQIAEGKEDEEEQ